MVTLPTTRQAPLSIDNLRLAVIAATPTVFAPCNRLLRPGQTADIRLLD
jgi:hypothetical protein